MENSQIIEYRHTFSFEQKNEGLQFISNQTKRNSSMLQSQPKSRLEIEDYKFERLSEESL